MFCSSIQDSHSAWINLLLFVDIKLTKAEKIIIREALNLILSTDYDLRFRMCITALVSISTYRSTTILVPGLTCSSVNWL